VTSAEGDLSVDYGSTDPNLPDGDAITLTQVHLAQLDRPRLKGLDMVASRCTHTHKKNRLPMKRVFSGYSSADHK
jgi:hypothetical protein